jgi:hypothetical protein
LDYPKAALLKPVTIRSLSKSIVSNAQFAVFDIILVYNVSLKKRASLPLAISNIASGLPS